MQPLLAEIRVEAPVTDKRGASRRTLRLGVEISPAVDVNALVHNLSETGLLLGTSAELAVGDRLEVELPHAGATGATVMWSRGGFAGCEFDSPLSRAAVSAALLKARPAQPEFVAPARPRLWSDLDDALVEADEAAASQPVLIVSMMVALLVALVLAVALLSFPLSA